MVKKTGTGNRVEDTRFPVTINGLSGRDAVLPQRKFGRCLAQSCSNLPGNKRSLKRNAAWLDLLRTAPSLGRTAQCSRPTQGKMLVVCSIKTRSDGEVLSL